LGKKLIQSTKLPKQTYPSFERPDSRAAEAAVALGPAAVIATGPAVVAAAVPKASASVGPAETIDRVIDEAIQQRLAPSADISALKAALAASTGVPMEYDRRLLGTCRPFLQRDLTGDERREMRSLFKKKVLTP
jgi:hypothetical protein